MSLLAVPPNPYDEIVFPTQPVPQSHPDRLAALATLFGMRPRPVDHCRVLELGCATGANLIPMAERHPDSTFLGIDSSPRQVALGRAAIKELELANIELRDLSILDVTDNLGSFDYILCTGVYSWVAAHVQAKILAVCRANLEPQGVAFVSYNCLPGWQVGRVIRELVCDVPPGDRSPVVRIAELRNRLGFFADVFTGDPAPAAQQLKVEIDRVLKKPDGYLFHEYLESDHEACYFHEFVERAAVHGLDYVGDAIAATMFATGFGDTIENNLRYLGGDVISIEQHMDLLRNRSFRQSLLCHRGVAIDRQLAPASAFPLHFSGQLRPESAHPDLDSRRPEAFMSREGAEIRTESPLLKTALFQLGRRWPQAISFDALLTAARTSGEGSAAPISNTDREGLGRGLVQCLAAGMVDIHSERDCFAATVSPLPVASPFARWQAKAGPLVTNRRHAQIFVDDVSRSVLRYLDGKHDRAALVRKLVEAVDRGQVTIMVNNLPAPRGEALVPVLEGTLDQCLARLAANAFLIG